MRQQPVRLCQGGRDQKPVEWVVIKFLNHSKQIKGDQHRC